MREVMIKELAYRPQVTFLPLTEKRGTCFVEPQFPNKRYEAEQRERETVREAEYTVASTVATVLVCKVLSVSVYLNPPQWLRLVWV